MKNAKKSLHFLYSTVGREEKIGSTMPRNNGGDQNLNNVLVKIGDWGIINALRFLQQGGVFMETSFILSCCSTADLSLEHFGHRNIEYVPFHYFVNGEHKFDDLWQSMSPEDFYTAMAEGADTKTSQVNTEDFCEYFRSLLNKGKDVLHVCLSSGLSGTFNSARLATEMLEEEFPNQKVYLVDSLGASSGFGLLMDKLADLRDEGKSAEEVALWAEQNRLHLHHWFFSTDLTFYVKGGRISKASGWFGTILKICPLLNMDNNGKLVPRFKIRGKNNVINAIVDKMEENAQGGLGYNGKCYICQSACMEDAQAVAALVEQRFPKLNGKVEIYPIGPTIGSHTGPGTVALFFWGNERID